MWLRGPAGREGVRGPRRWAWRRWLVLRQGRRVEAVQGCTGSRGAQLPVLSDDVVAPAAVAPADGADSGAGTPAHAIGSEFSPLGGGSVKGAGRASPHRGGGLGPCLTTTSMLFLPIMA